MKRNISRVYVCVYLNKILSRFITDNESYPKSDMTVNNKMK